MKKSKTKLCVVCGKGKGKYSFGYASLPIGKGCYKKLGKKFLEYDVVKWIGKTKKFHYIKCEKCYKE